MRNQTKLAVAIGLALACFSTAPSYAAGEGRLLFVNSQTGRLIGAGVDRNGYFETSFDVTNPAYVGIDSLIPTASGFILYSYANGGARAYLMDGNAADLAGSFSPFSAKWEYAIGAGNYAIFYNLNGNQKTGAIVESYPDGTLHQTYTSSSFSSWTTIGQTDNYFLFYNAPNGSYVTASIDVNGQLLQNTTLATRRAGYTNFASVGENVLLWNVANGVWESGSLGFTGAVAGAKYAPAYVARGTDALLLKGYDLSVAMNGHLMLYNSATGAAIVGHFIQPLQFGGAVGTFVKDQAFTLAKYYTDLVRCGNFLIFYQYGVGQIQMGYIGFDGTYQPTQSFTIGAGLTVAASRK